MKKNKIVKQKITELKMGSRTYCNGKRPGRREGGGREALTEKAVGATLQIMINKKINMIKSLTLLILLPSLFQLIPPLLEWYRL